MATLPKTMKGVSIARTGGVEVLEYKTDLPVPQPQEGEVLIKNDFISINFFDTSFRTGRYPVPHMPYILGREASGTIVSRGVSTAEKPIPPSLRPNTSVVYLAPSCYAEYTVALPVHVFPLPPDVDRKTAAAALSQGLTALTLIRESHHVEQGDWVLVQGAAGGVGLWLCQFLKSLGAHAIGTASTAAKKELAKKHGAELVLDYPEQSEAGTEQFVAKITDFTNGHGVEAVFDGVGKATFDASLLSIKRNGSLVVFGNASGDVPPFQIARLREANVRLSKPSVYNSITTREEFETYAKELFDIVGREKTHVEVHKVYELKEVASAHTDLEGRKTVGKILLKA